MGWSGIKNGELLRKAEPEFDCFLTVDRNLQFQQHITALSIAVLVMRARDNRIEALRPLMPKVEEALRSVKAGELRLVGA
jgi:hypothetical protein